MHADGFQKLFGCSKCSAVKILVDFICPFFNGPADVRITAAVLDEAVCELGWFRSSNEL